MSDDLVIVGGGVAAARAIEGIREAGSDAPVVLVAAEQHLPYEKPPLSKGTLAGDDPLESAILHPEKWYAEHGVTLRLGTEASAIDPAAHTVALADGGTLPYGRLLLATGSTARRLDVPGADLANVLTLRSMDESAELRSRLVAGSDVVLVGAGWIGLEVAAAARIHGCNVTVIEPQPTPLFGVLGPEVGGWFSRLHESHGVTFRFGDGVVEMSGDGAVSAVVTNDGERIEADTVVVGVGISPNVDLATAAGLDVDNGILCDAALRTSAVDVFAAGDVANWLNPTLGERVRVEHWANANDGGYAAGQSMAGAEVSYGPVPFFFSDQYDVGLEYAGFVPRGVDTDVLFRGDPESNEFMAFWLADVRVLAGMHVNVWDTIDDVQALIRSRTAIDPDKLADPGVELNSLVP
jgi:3-phenylpropionate/trans-cinnamate dioxygenase ferredoxin reductase subunit